VNILITGAAGFLGRELVSHLLELGHSVVGLAHSESRYQEISFSENNERLQVYNLDISNTKSRICQIVKKHSVDFIIHTAAMKHVRICEDNPTRAIEVNVLGTKNIIDAAIENNVKNVIGISTDKATNPSCVYGVTKYLTEKILLEHGFSVFQGVNFFFSTGSVLDIWDKQRTQNKPISVSDRNMVRYFVPVSDVVEKITSSLGTTDDYIFNEKCYRVSLHDLYQAYREYHSYFEQIKYDDISQEKQEEELFYNIEIENPNIEQIKLMIDDFYQRRKSSWLLK